MKRIAILLLAAAPLAACEDAAGPTGGVRGTYDLVRVNGNPLPEVFIDLDVSGTPLTITMLSGELTLRGETYTEEWVVNTLLGESDLGVDTLSANGSYSVDGQLISFEPDAGTSFGGTIQGNTITATEVEPSYDVEVGLTWTK